MYIYRFSPGVVADCMEDSLITWLLVAACSPHCIKNPYLVAKIIEVLFVINPGIQSRTEQLHSRVMAHPISEMHLPSCLMKFYTGVQNITYSRGRRKLKDIDKLSNKEYGELT